MAATEAGERAEPAPKGGLPQNNTSVLYGYQARAEVCSHP